MVGRAWGKKHVGRGFDDAWSWGLAGTAWGLDTPPLADRPPLAVTEETILCVPESYGSDCCSVR